MTRSRGLVYALLFGILHWVLDSVDDILSSERGIIASLFLPSAHELLMRVGMIVLFIYAAWRYSKKELSLMAAREMVENSEVIQGKILEAIPQKIFFKDRQSTYIFCNEHFAVDVATDAATIKGKTDFDIFEKRFAEKFRADDQRVMRAGKVEELEEEYNAGDLRLWAHTIKTPVRDAAGEVIGILGIYQDVTEKKLAEWKIARLSRLYQTISKASESIVYIRHRSALLERICEVIVKHGGFRMAWIGFVDPETHRIVPAAKWGDAENYVEGLRLSIDPEMPGSKGPSGVCIREGRHVINQDTDSNPALGPWRERAHKSGFRSSAAFPLTVDGVRVGCINIYSGEQAFFNKEEVELLGSLSRDLSFALEALEREEKRKKAEKALEELNRTLERRVEERTADLSRLNRDLNAEVTVRRRAEAELMFKALLLDKATDSIIVLDRDGNIVYANRTACVARGYGPEEMIGRPITMFHDETRRDMVQKQVESSLMRGEMKLQTTHLCKDGSLLPVEVNAKVIEVDGRQLIVSVIRDIRDRLKAEEDVRQSEERLAAFVNGINESTFLIDPSGIVLMVNETGAKRFNRSVEELVGTPVSDYMPPDLAASRTAKLRQVAETGQEVHFQDEREGCHYRNSLFPVRDAMGNVYAVAAIAYDITEPVLAQRELEKARDEAEQATALKDKFVALVSHDLKTPLVGVVGLMQLLRREAEGDPEKARIIDLAAESCRKMTRLIDELLDISRIRQGKLQMKCAYIDGGGVMAYAFAAAAEMAERKGIALRNLVPQRTIVWADPVFLQQVFMNLLTNAVKFTEKGGTVTAGAAVDGVASFWVQDNGVGVPREIRHKLFSPYEKTTTRGTAGETGTGFGLPLSHDIMVAHGGRLDLDSPEEGGARFNATLPVRQARIAVMESVLGSCPGIAKALAEHHFVLRPVSGALEVLDNIPDEPIDLVLAEVCGGENGVGEMMRLMKGDDRLKHVPVVGLVCGCSEFSGKGRGFAALLPCNASEREIGETIHAALIGR